MIKTDQFELKGLWKTYEEYSQVEKKKYKEELERNVVVQGGCVPSEMAWIGWSAAGKRMSGSNMVGK